MTYNQIYDALKANKADVLESLDRAYQCAYYAGRDAEVAAIRERKIAVLRCLAVKAKQLELTAQH